MGKSILRKLSNDDNGYCERKLFKKCTALIGVGFFASAPVAVPVVLIGGMGLFIWEQAENYNGW